MKALLPVLIFSVTVVTQDRFNWDTLRASIADVQGPMISRLTTIRVSVISALAKPGKRYPGVLTHSRAPKTLVESAAIYPLQGNWDVMFATRCGMPLYPTRLIPALVEDCIPAEW